MEVFRLGGRHLTRLKQISGRKSDKSEKIIQKLIETNLHVIFPELEFLKSEYRIKGKKRPDSMAFDKNSNSFVIIEYKNVKKSGAVEQVMAYRSLLQENESEFLMMYYKQKNMMPEVDFGNTRSIIIAPKFTDEQKQISSDHGIELYEITKYDEGIMVFNYIGSKKESKIATDVFEQDNHGKTDHTFLSAAKIILEEVGKPLHYKEITTRIIERNLMQTDGLKPWNSLRSAISRDRKKGGSAFTAPARGMIGLRSQDYPDRGEPSPLNKSSNSQYLSAALKILNGSNGPLHYKEITKKAIETGLLNTVGNTPMETMASKIYTDVKKNPDSIFKRTGKGTFDLKSKIHTEFETSKSTTSGPSGYSEEDYLLGAYKNAIPSKQTRDLYYRLKSLILDTFPNTEAKQTKKYVALRLKGRGPTICTIEVQRDRLKIFYSTDRAGIIPIDSFVLDYKGKGHYGNGDYGSYIKNDHDVGRAIPLIGRIYDLKS